MTVLSAAEHLQGGSYPCTPPDYQHHAQVVDYYGGTFYDGQDMTTSFRGEEAPPAPPPAPPSALPPLPVGLDCPGNSSTWPRKARGPRTWPEGDPTDLQHSHTQQQQQDQPQQQQQQHPLEQHQHQGAPRS